MTVEAIHVFNAYVFECYNDSNYIDIYMLHSSLFSSSPWTTQKITLGHVYKHYLEALRLRT